MAWGDRQRTPAASGSVVTVQADRQLVPEADYHLVPGAGRFVALDRPDVLADLLDATA